MCGYSNIVFYYSRRLDLLISYSSRILQLLGSRGFQPLMGLVTLFILFWSFCIYSARKPILITSWTVRNVVWNNPHSVNFIFTPICTIFSITTTYFFIRCVRCAMQKGLTRTLETRSFMRWNAIANKHIASSGTLTLDHALSAVYNPSSGPYLWVRCNLYLSGNNYHQKTALV